MADQDRDAIMAALVALVDTLSDVTYTVDASKSFEEIPSDKLPAVVVTEGPSRVERNLTATVRFMMEARLTVYLPPRDSDLEVARDIVDKMVVLLESNPSISGTAINTSITRVEQPSRWPASGLFEDNIFVEIEYRRDYT